MKSPKDWAFFLFFLQISTDNFEKLLGQMKNSDENHCFTRFLLRVLVL